MPTHFASHNGGDDVDLSHGEGDHYVRGGRDTNRVSDDSECPLNHVEAQPHSTEFVKNVDYVEDVGNDGSGGVTCPATREKSWNNISMQSLVMGME
ncbi:hypothetical protein HN51_068292 [Arachis hypogaea]